MISKCYFTLLDLYSIKEIVTAQSNSPGDRAIMAQLRAKLKAALLVYDQVIFRGTAIFPRGSSRPYARDLIAEAKNLLEEGALVPELRRKDVPLAKQIRDNPKAFELDSIDAKSFVWAANAIDGAKKKHEPDAMALSTARSTQLIEHVFRIWHQRRAIDKPLLKADANLSHVEDLFRVLEDDDSQPPDRKKTIIPRCNALFRHPRDVMALIQTIYFGIGGLEAKADLYLPESTRLPSQIRQYPPLDPRKFTRDEHRVADRFGISERLKQPDPASLVQVSHMLDVMGVTNSDLRHIGWADIAAIRRSMVGKQAREKIWSLRAKQASDVKQSQASDAEKAVSDLESLLREQMRHEKAMMARGSAASVASKVVGFICKGAYPVMGTFFSRLPWVEKFPIIKATFTPLTAFQKAVRGRAL